MAGSKGDRVPRSGTRALAPVIVAMLFLVVAVVAAGFGKYVMSVVSLISGLAILSYVVEVGRHEG